MNRYIYAATGVDDERKEFAKNALKGFDSLEKL